MNVWDQVDAYRKKWETDFATAKEAAESLGFSRRVKWVAPGVWVARRRESFPGGGHEIVARSVAELSAAMKAFDDANPRKKGG